MNSWVVRDVHFFSFCSLARSAKFIIWGMSVFSNGCCGRSWNDLLQQAPFSGWQDDVSLEQSSSNYMFICLVHSLGSCLQWRVARLLWQSRTFAVVLGAT